LTMRSIWKALLFSSVCLNVVLVCLIMAGIHRFQHQLMYDIQSVTPIGMNYSVLTYRNSTEGRALLDILRNGSLVYSEKSDGKFSVVGDGNDASPVAPGYDITGEGIPDVVVAQWNGSAKGYCVYSVFAVGEQFRKVDTICGLLSVEFGDFDHDGHVEIKGLDRGFECFNGCSGSESPLPRVVLRFDLKAGKFAVDWAAMRMPALSKLELEELASSLRKSDEWTTSGQPPTELASRMLALIYAGQEEAAWGLLDMSWPTDLTGQDTYRSLMNRTLASSQYYRTPQQMGSR
jgi:hypothetical protein